MLVMTLFLDEAMHQFVIWRSFRSFGWRKTKPPTVCVSVASPSLSGSQQKVVLSAQIPPWYASRAALMKSDLCACVSIRQCYLEKLFGIKILSDRVVIEKAYLIAEFSANQLRWASLTTRRW
jgi:hypothetical protein